MISMFLVVLAASYFLHTLAYESSIYYSTVSLQNLLRNQQNLLNQFEEFLKNVTDKSSENVELVKNYIRSYNEMVATDELVTEILMHPVTGFHFFKHVVTDWHLLMILLKGDTVFQDILAELNSYRKQQQFAELNDLHNTAASIGRMQYIYQIPMDQIIQGIIKSNNSNQDVYQSRRGLDSWDCLTIGKSTFKRDYVKPAVEWLQTALELVVKDNKVSLYEISDILQIALRKKKELESSPEYEMLEEKMGTLCRGESLGKERSDSDLVCKYSTIGDSKLLIAPFKLEILSKDPPIMGFYDFLNEAEANRMKEIASPKLFSSSVMTEENNGASFERTSQQYWMGNSEDPNLSLGISRRIEEATGLFTDASKPEPCCVAEQYQVLNYGIGGLYLTHRDYLSFNDGYEEDYWYINGGDRIATFLIYLNDVEVGGATVFPLADVTVWPKRGFAAFWYNLQKNGEPDPTTEHGGCPVLYGFKWISNKWIHEKFQDKEKCGLQETEKYAIL